MDRDMKDPNLETEFASAERLNSGAVEEQFIEVKNAQGIRIIFQKLPNITMILNHQRQIVYSNQCLLDFLNLSSAEDILGQRPGEVVNCVHSHENPGGCGTSKSCSTCGAVLAILATQETGERTVKECRITRRNGKFEEALDFRVWTDSAEIGGTEYTIMSILDISDEKRRRILERIFFHDVRNTINALLGCADMMKCRLKTTQENEFPELTAALIEQLLSEIEGQEQLAAAESNELKVKTTVIKSQHLLEKIIGKYLDHPLRNGKDVVISDDSEAIAFESDPTLLERVLTNMLKNALEATKRGDTITVGSRSEDDRIEIWVHNPGEMSKEVQLQMFQRSFSTKGEDRGIGTYSMKLLTQRYLLGSINFSSSAEQGTTFTVRLSIQYPG